MRIRFLALSLTLAGLTLALTLLVWGTHPIAVTGIQMVSSSPPAPPAVLPLQSSYQI